MVNFAQVLVDTGATHTQLPAGALRNVGIDAQAQGRPMTIATANGPATRWLIQLDLELQGVRVQGVRACVRAGATPLIGRSALHAAFAVTGFSRPEWLHTQQPAVPADAEEGGLDDEQLRDLRQALQQISLRRNSS